MSTTDPYNLARFLTAQEPCYQQVLNELSAGHKSTHWMWFIFPQFVGLGRSRTAENFAIKSRQEAEAYLMHPVLGKRLIQCIELVLSHKHKSAENIFGFPDYLKFKSSLTLFYSVGKEKDLYRNAINTFYHGELDENTRKLLLEN